MNIRTEFVLQHAKILCWEKEQTRIFCHKKTQQQLQKGEVESLTIIVEIFLNIKVR